MTEERQYAGYLEEELALLRSKLAKQKAEYEEKILDLVDELYSMKDEFNSLNAAYDTLCLDFEVIRTENEKLHKTDKVVDAFDKGWNAAIRAVELDVTVTPASFKSTTLAPKYYVDRADVIDRVLSLSKEGV